MHFDFTVTLGNLITVVALIGAIWRAERLLQWFLVEHEILIKDYCERHGVEVKDLPTRSRA